MKRAERKELDKFVNEKFDILHDTSGLDYTPSDMAEKKQKLIEYYSNSIKKQECSTKSDSKYRKRKLFVGFATGAVSFILIAVAVLVSILKPNDEFYYNDDDLVSSQYNLVEFQENFNVLLPDMTDIASLTISVYRSDERNINVYAKLVLTNGLEEKIELTIIFVDNYNFQSEQQYNSLAETGQTTIFSYSYNIIEDIEVSYAKFIYNNYKYYVRLVSETPSNITSIIELFT